MPLRQRIIGLLIFTGLLTPVTLHGQTISCEEAFDAVDTSAADIARDTGLTGASTNEDWCSSLATYLVDLRVGNSYLTEFYEQKVPANLLQPVTGASAATGGSPAQSEAIPSVQPLALAGGSVSAVGTGGGASAVTALTINPTVFAFSPEAKRQIARWSRFGDISVFFPVAGLDEDEDGAVDYFGVRARVNFTGPSRGSQIMERAVSEFRDLVNQDVWLVDQVEKLLLEAGAGATACALAIFSDSGVSAACPSSAAELDGNLTLDTSKAKALQDALAEARREADALFWGLDLRLDQGDPTLGELVGAAGTRLFGGTAYGRRLSANSTSSLDLRIRAGIQYFAQQDYTDSVEVNIDSEIVKQAQFVQGETNYAFDAAMGFVIERTIEQQVVNFSSGFELRLSGAPEDKAAEFLTDYLLFRASLNVPITAANSLSINVGAPLWGEISPTLSINADWTLLLPSD